MRVPPDSPISIVPRGISALCCSVVWINCGQVPSDDHRQCEYAPGRAIGVRESWLRLVAVDSVIIAHKSFLTRSVDPLVADMLVQVRTGLFEQIDDEYALVLG